MESIPDSLEIIASKVKTLSARNPAYAEVVQWVGDLLAETVREGEPEEIYLLEMNPDLKIDSTDKLEAWKRGRSFLTPRELTLDWKNITALYKRLVELVKKREDGRQQETGLLNAITEMENGAPEVIKAVLASDVQAIETSAKALNIDSPVLALLLKLALRPALTGIAQVVLKQVNLSHWHYGHCPVCGSMPRLADLSGEGGKRRLHCSLCEAAWPYPRLRCPFCENDNREELVYLQAEKEKGLRVDLCGRCNHYLKTIDLRELAGPIIVPLDDTATWHLDIIAVKNLEDKGSDLSRAT
ncbi:MAG: formate dehydrogenase accessory protein FdhE [Desulfobacterales bacterium]